ncbi:hypothetical protein D3C85_1727240 [compost metagenome]
MAAHQASIGSSHSDFILYGDCVASLVLHDPIKYSSAMKMMDCRPSIMMASR